MVQLFDVFHPGLRRGGERLTFDPSKKYFYVEHPKEGWRVYLRSAIFLHPTNEPFNPQHFLVAKKTRARKTSAVWEPAGKGQMEWKDHSPRSSILSLLKENITRETEEESHIIDIKNLKHSGLVFQSQETDFPPNHYFQYHIFQGFITPEELQKAESVFQWAKEHPKAFQRWSRDKKEKDAIEWFNPKTTRLNPRWCPDIVVLYLRNIKKPL